jgi:plasmid stability protein
MVLLKHVTGYQSMARPGPKQKQMGVALPDGLRKKLEEASAATGRSIAEEIRERLVLTFLHEDIDDAVRNFMAQAGVLALFVSNQTGQDWRTHPGANAALRHAINARLGRTKEDGEETFSPGELPSTKLVASRNPQTIGVSLEAILEFGLKATEGNAEAILGVEASEAKQRKERKMKEAEEKESKRDGT